MADALFISYCTADDVWSQLLNRHLVRRLRQWTIHFFPAGAIPAGSNIPSFLLDALRDSKVYLIVVSRAATTSNWVKREVAEAIRQWDLDNTRRVVPLMLDRNMTHLAAIHPRLGDFTFIDFSNPNVEMKTLHSLVFALRHPGLPINSKEPSLPRFARATWETTKRLFLGT